MLLARGMPKFWLWHRFRRSGRSRGRPGPWRRRARVLLAAAFLGSSILTIVVALTADRFGRRRVLLDLQRADDTYWRRLCAQRPVLAPVAGFYERHDQCRDSGDRSFRHAGAGRAVADGAGQSSHARLHHVQPGGHCRRLRGALFAGGVAALTGHPGSECIGRPPMALRRLRCGSVRGLAIALGLSSAVELGAPPALASAFGYSSIPQASSSASQRCSGGIHSAAASSSRASSPTGSPCDSDSESTRWDQYSPHQTFSRRSRFWLPKGWPAGLDS